MADYIKKIRTSNGDKQIDYEALANLPTIPLVDMSLTNEGAAADAKATGDAINLVNTRVEEKVENPLTGVVGQILEIETVDESGKPKTYKAVNKPSGGGEVTDEQISNAVDNYMTAHPFTETDPTVPDWAKHPEKPRYTAEEVGADASGTAESKVSEHNVSDTAHNDIRLLIDGLTTRLNALADSDDTTLDQMSEVVAYIKSNKSLIDAITTSKVNVSDIIDNLTTNASNKPLSAAQGVALKTMIDGITIPTTLPNPNALTFTGAATGSYDGSSPVEINIPEGGGTGVTVDTTLGVAGQAADAKATGDAIGQLSKEIVNKQPKGNYALKSDIPKLSISDIFAPSPQIQASSNAIIVKSLDEMTDVSKKYVLNGYIYECVVTEIVKSYTNVLKTAKDTDGSIYNGKGYKDNTRLNSSGEVKDASGVDIDTSGKITCKAGDRLRIQSVKTSKNYATYIYSYNDSNVKQGVYKISDAVASTTTQNIDMTLDSATFGANFTNIRFCSGDITDSTIVTINEAIEESTETTYEWVNTDELYEYSDFDAETCTAQDIYDYLDVLCSKYPNYITKETLGKDESGTLDCNRYVLSKHFYSAWQKVNYPKMYAFVNGSTVIYATSVSPRIGDTLYTTKYIGTAYAKVTAVNTPSQTRTINGKSFTRDESKDVEPTLVYTSILADSVGSNGIVYNESQSGVSMISSISATSMTDSKSVNYTRYPLGDRNRNMEKPIVVTIGANEHGPQGDPKEPAIVCARFMKDLCECKNSDNELLNHLKNNIMLVIMPIINPYGFTHGDDTASNRYGYYNYNNININRNYDCAGFGQETNAGGCGDYGGSENETQYFMNTLAEPKSAVGISIHALGYTSGGNDGLCHYQGNGFNTDKMNEITENMKANYNLKFTSYGEAPQETTAKSPTYISKIGAKGGIIEMQAREGYIADSTAQLHSARILEAGYTLLLECIYAWLTDYEESLTN